MLEEKKHLVFLISLLVTLVSILFLRPFALKLGITDVPTKRKDHNGDIPLVGGLSISIAVYFSLFVPGAHNNIFIIFMISSFFILLLGFIDDCFKLTPRTRIILQILIVSFMVWMTDLKFDNFGHSFGFKNQINLGVFSYPFTVIGIVFLMNAFNLIDGLDGLAGSTSILVILSINFNSMFSSNGNILLLSIALIGSLLTFLCFNLSKSRKIFLGDSGSLFLGYSISFILLYESQLNMNFSPALAIWAIAIPVFDTIAVVIIRFKNSYPIFSADRNHLHHFLKDCGLSEKKILLMILSLILLLMLFGYIAEKLLQYSSLPVFLFIMIIYIFLRVTNLKTKF